jgi:hypothetical protein
MPASSKRSTIYLDQELHLALPLVFYAELASRVTSTKYLVFRGRSLHRKTWFPVCSRPLLGRASLDAFALPWICLSGKLRNKMSRPSLYAHEWPSGPDPVIPRKAIPFSHVPWKSNEFSTFS